MQRKVMWVEGLLLSQQHLQQWDLYQEQQHRFYWQALHPFGWGLLSLSIDDAALLNGQFRIKRLQAILPHGQSIDYHEQTDPLLCCDLSISTVEHMIEIYLALPANHLGDGINGYPKPLQLAAYCSDYRMIADEFDSERQREVMQGKLNLRLLSNEESRMGFYTLKIAEVIDQGGKQFILSKTYIPPLMQIRASFLLQEMLQTWHEWLFAKQRLLFECKDVFLQDMREFYQLLLRQALAKVVPCLEHIRRYPQTHPLQIYFCFAELCQGLAAFKIDRPINDMPIYQHDQLYEVFNQLLTLIKEILDAIMPVTMQMIRLIRESDSLYTATFIDSRLFDSCSFFLAVKLDKNDLRWVDVLLRQVKIASRQVIETLVTSALLGVGLRFVTKPPNKLAIKAGYEYFYLEPHGEFWQGIINERNLAIFIPYDFAHAHMELIAVQEDVQ